MLALTIKPRRTENWGDVAPKAVRGKRSEEGKDCCTGGWGMAQQKTTQVTLQRVAWILIMAFRKVFQERFGDNGKGDKIQRQCLAQYSSWSKFFTYENVVALTHSEVWGWREIMGRIPQNRPNNLLLSIFFGEQSQEVEASCPCLLTQKCVEPMTVRKLTWQFTE